MPWSNARPGGGKTAAKYRTPEHRRTRAAYAAQLQRDGYLTCAQPVCTRRSRTIHPGDDWAAGHNDAGTAYIGPVHRDCNIKAAAVAARSRQGSSRLRW